MGDADELYEFQRANGAEIVAPPADGPHGLRDYTVRDQDGHELGFGHRLSDAGPPLEIERVDAPIGAAHRQRSEAPSPSIEPV